MTLPGTRKYIKLIFSEKFDWFATAMEILNRILNIDLYN